ncbi:MAG: biotin/lipoate A/B protein ligase family protein [Candidatus Avelusimicrobium sp.]|uniref:lipoate--protein ligase family protein n=1 Tax=Candidatus Avelusimicrobium sp. TaxID=3048833 RepID=UPI003F077074
MNLLVSTPPLNVFEQMAFDEQTVHLRPSAVTLRFYRWTDSPAVTFGYAQFLSEVDCALSTQRFAGPRVRRPTGGGIVFHADDLTFSLVFPYKDRPAEIYRSLHRCILAQLERAGQTVRAFDKTLPAVAYAPSINHSANACFINPVENDLIAADGHKILGGALRRFGEWVLYQGSLQLPCARTNPLYRRAVTEAVRTFFAADFRPCGADASWLESARRLAQTQYNTAAWIGKF